MPLDNAALEAEVQLELRLRDFCKGVRALRAGDKRQGTAVRAERLRLVADAASLVQFTSVNNFIHAHYHSIPAAKLSVALRVPGQNESEGAHIVKKLLSTFRSRLPELPFATRQLIRSIIVEQGAQIVTKELRRLLRHKDLHVSAKKVTRASINGVTTFQNLSELYALEAPLFWNFLDVVMRGLNRSELQGSGVIGSKRRERVLWHTNVHANAAPFHFELNDMLRIMGAGYGTAPHGNSVDLHAHAMFTREKSMNSARPVFHLAEDLMYTSLAGCVLNRVRVASNQSTIEEMKNTSLTKFSHISALARLTIQKYKGFAEGAAEALAEGDELDAFDLTMIDELIRHEEYRRAIADGEIGSMWVVYKRLVHCFKGAGMFNYANHIMEMFVKYDKELSPEMRIMYEATWLLKEREGSAWIGTDLGVERDVGAGKQALRDTKGNWTMDQLINVASGNVDFRKHLSYTVPNSVGIKTFFRPHHTLPRVDEVLTVLRDLIETGVTQRALRKVDPVVARPKPEAAKGKKKGAELTRAEIDEDARKRALAAEMTTDTNLAARSAKKTKSAVPNHYTRGLNDWASNKKTGFKSWLAIRTLREAETKGDPMPPEEVESDEDSGSESDIEEMPSVEEIELQDGNFHTGEDYEADVQVEGGEEEQEEGEEVGDDPEDVQEADAEREQAEVEMEL
ncbi:hypothetical protein P7C70_g7387, partial [Phenoliferia sp. Uapishka_3]